MNLFSRRSSCHMK
uniref:Uncharacterized protein n=1 Tax=Anopheles dirus TaxID=7168 RepID=A0A182NY31_9DIPT